MKRILTALACAFAFAMACNAQMTAARMMAYGGAERAPEGFVITFTSGTTPSSISLHSSYAGPKTAALALYDSGDGVWTSYTSRTIPVKGNYVAFKGDWRNSAGTYAYMFKSTLADAAYTCRFSGAFTVYPTHQEAYREMFRDCSRVTDIADNPIPNLSGAPASYMFSYACSGMSSVTALPANFMNTSGLTGAPASSMFNNACNGMTSVTNAYVFQLSPNITFTPENVVSLNALTAAFINMPKFTGSVMWGDQNLFTAFTPTEDVNTINGSPLIQGYTEAGANWK